jgi:hypothetical protein
VKCILFSGTGQQPGSRPLGAGRCVACS